MYFLFHFFTGIILGFLLSDFLRDRRWLIPCAIGAILPDLIDKPLGHIFLAQTIGNGRIYSHTLLAAIFIIGAGLAYWHLKKDPGVFAVGIGVLSHQVLDLMWLEPRDWYYPLLGPFKGATQENYVWVMFWEELKNPFELILALIAILSVFILIYRYQVTNIVSRHSNVISSVMAFCALLLCSLSGILLGWGLSRHNFPGIGWTHPEELMIGGVVLGLAASMVWRWQNIIDRKDQDAAET